MHEKLFFTFLFLVTSTFRAQSCSASYSCPVHCFTKSEVSMAFLFWDKKPSCR